MSSLPTTESQLLEFLTADFDGELPDAIFVHGGGMEPVANKVADFRILSWSGVSEHGLPTGGRNRVVAGAALAAVAPEIPIITSSFDATRPHDQTMASVTKDELIQRGVNEDRITLEERSFTTITQLMEMVALSERQDWNNVLGITNAYHLPRSSEMLRQIGALVNNDNFSASLESFEDKGGKAVLAGAEPVMRIVSPWYGKYLDRVEKSTQYAAAVAAEAKGLADLKAGNYNVRIDYKVDTPKA